MIGERRRVLLKKKKQGETKAWTILSGMGYTNPEKRFLYRKGSENLVIARVTGQAHKSKEGY